jgi:transcriptional regulator with XRE-family HTH domain
MSIDVTRTATLSERVAAEIRAEMGRRQMSGRELARRLGRSANWVSLKVSGTQRIDLAEWEIIAEAIGVKVADLLPRRDREVTETSHTEQVKSSVRSIAAPPPRAPSRPADSRPVGRSDASTRPQGSFRTSRIA